MHLSASHPPAENVFHSAHLTKSADPDLLITLPCRTTVLGLTTSELRRVHTVLTGELRQIS